MAGATPGQEPVVNAPSASLRLFAAVSPAAPVRMALCGLQQHWLALLAEADPAAARRLRAVEEAALHLTLRFYGATPAARRPELQQRLAADAAAASRSEARLQRLEHWPPRAPRVLVAAFDAPPALLALAETLEASARTLGFAQEARPFRAHVTLARGRGHPLPRVPVPLPPLALPIDAITLFQSRTLPTGPTYTPRHTAPLPM